MSNYTQLPADKLRVLWAQFVGYLLPPIRRSLIVKYLIWYEQAKREKLSPLGFFNEVKDTAQALRKRTVVLEPGSQITRSYKGVVYTVETVTDGYLYKDKIYKSLSGIAKAITGKSWNGKVFFGVKDER